MKAKMLFVKIEIWFLMLLRVEYFYCHQLRVQVLKYEHQNICFNDSQ